MTGRPDHTAFLAFAHRLADVSGAMLRTAALTPPVVDIKADASYVTATDKAIEQRLRLEAIQQGLPGGAPALPPQQQPGGGSTLPPSSGAAVGQGDPGSAQPGAGQPLAAQAQPAAPQPSEVERAPLPRPAAASAPAKSKSRNPFRPFQEGSP